MKVEKSGCILVNKETKKIGLIYREKQKDYSFPKGHREGNESLIECALRETVEETKRNCEMVCDKPVMNEHYFDSKKDEVDMYYFIAIDKGPSDNLSEDTHDLVWVNYDEVAEILSYDSLRIVWDSVKDQVKDLLNS